MLNKEDFKEGELDELVAKLTAFHSDPANLHNEIVGYFETFDSDKNGFLDRRELRHFLNLFFSKYHIKLPLTDDFVDGVFRQMDTSHDNKI